MWGSDLLVTHLDLTNQAVMLAMATKIPLIHFVHNCAQLMCWRVDARVPYKNALTVYNSHWLAAKPSSYNGQVMPDEWRAPSVVVHPVVEKEYYECERGNKITLVNPTPGKGAATFRALATLMPQRKFLAVEGGYGEQMILAPDAPRKGGAINAGGNIAWMAHTPDIRKVFRQTKVLLMPSEYESFGRVGIEAACCGIPTIAHPTPGLKEAFGDAGIFLDRNDIPAWFNEVERLMTDDIYYHQRSQIVLELAQSIKPEEEFNRLEQAFLATVERYRKGIESVKMWKSDKQIWKLTDGSYKITSDGRIPAGAVSLYAGIGTDIPESVAKEHGWIGPDAHSKSIEQPEENKAIASPDENKARKKKSDSVAA